MYELFVLGELFDQPLHGYLLRDIVNLAFGPVRQMSWGSLYPLIRRLEANNLIAQIATAQEPAKARRKTYTITDAGKERFYFLMLRPEEYSTDYPELFGVKLTNFDRVTAEQRMDILLHYQGYLQFVLDRLAEGERFVAQQQKIAEAERALILRTVDRRLYLTKADLAWLEEQIRHFASSGTV